MRFAQHEDRWTIWGYPDDPEWDRRTYDIGYTTDSGTGTVVASGLTLEDATTILALPDYRVWSAGTLGNLGNMPALPCVDRFVVAADNDWNKPDAMAAFDKAVAKLKSQGVPVKVARAPRGKDMNDLLKGETI